MLQVISLICLTCLQVRYRGADWQDTKNWGCNFELNPFGVNYVDSGSLEAMEGMFVKVKQRVVDRAFAYASQALRYDRWRAASVSVRSPHHPPCFPFRF